MDSILQLNVECRNVCFAAKFVLNHRHIVDIFLYPTEVQKE